MNLLQPKAFYFSPRGSGWEGLEKHGEMLFFLSLFVTTRGSAPGQRSEEEAGPRGGGVAEDGGCRPGSAGARVSASLVWLSACLRNEVAWDNFQVSLERLVWFLKCWFPGVISQALSEPPVVSALSESEGWFVVRFVFPILFFGWL